MKDTQQAAYLCSSLLEPPVGLTVASVGGVTGGLAASGWESKCRNVLVSCLCRILEMCAGVRIVDMHARTLARACAHVLRRRRRTSLRTLETARPFSGCRTTGPRCEREGTRHAVHCSRKFCSLYISTRYS